VTNPLFVCSIPGRPIVKKNTQRVVGFGRAKRVIYSPRYRAWECGAIAACKRSISTALLCDPLTAVFRFYFANRQSLPDTSNLIEGIQDVLKKSQVIEDDGLIHRILAERFVGSEPRIEVELHKYASEIA
jgi:Holliday junction resolvase RusA-like endonuclease